jgi:hypothetical protein
VQVLTGRPLRNGERLRVGLTPAGTDLLLRVDVGSRDYVATAGFGLPDLAAGSELQVEISGSSSRPAVNLVLGDGRILEADRISVPNQVAG